MTLDGSMEMRPPHELGVDEIRQYLTHLAVEKHVAASTQNIALSALLFPYKQVLIVDLPYIDNIERAKQPDRLRVVFTSEEVRNILAQLESLPHLVTSLLSGSGMRLGESLRLRVKDLDFTYQQIVQELLGHKDVKTTMIYTPVPNKGGRGVCSPLDVCA